MPSNFLFTIILKNVLVTVIAENMDTRIPMPKVIAKPLIIEVPNQAKIIQVIIEEMFESLIDGQALVKPFSMAVFRLLPSRNFSLVR